MDLKKLEEVKKLIYRKDCDLLYNSTNHTISRLKNEVAREFYFALIKARTYEEVIEVLTQKYGQSKETIKNDLDCFVNSIFNLSTNEDIRIKKGFYHLEFPLSIELEITSKCNWKCDFCYNTWHAISDFKHMELKLEDFKRILDECKRMKCMTIRYSGGEPFLHKDFYRMLEYSALLGMNNVIFTNGSFIQSKKDIKELSERNVSQILISYHGMRDVHEALTGISGSYDATVAAIRLILESSIRLTVEIALTKQNIKYMKDTLESLVALNVKHICIMRYVGTGRNDLDNEVSYGQLEKVINICSSILQNNADIKFVFSCSQRLCFEENPMIVKGKNKEIEDRKFFLLGSCEAGFNWCSVSVDGKIRICPHSDISFGIINEGIKKGWDNMRAQVIQIIEKFSCNSCYYFTDCLNGCYLSQIKNIAKEG